MCLLSWWQWLQAMMLLKFHNWEGTYSTTSKPDILVAQNILLVLRWINQKKALWSQRKYAFDILEGTGMTECRPIESPMDQSQKLIVDQGEPFSYPERYRI